MNHSFEIITSLQYSLKAATAQVEAFQSGKKYLDTQKAHEEKTRKLSMRIQYLEKELEKEHAKELAQAVKKRGSWRNGYFMRKGSWRKRKKK